MISLTSTLIILDITKTSSNNCLIFKQSSRFPVVPIHKFNFLKLSYNKMFWEVESKFDANSDEDSKATCMIGNRRCSETREKMVSCRNQLP